MGLIRTATVIEGAQLLWVVAMLLDGHLEPGQGLLGEVGTVPGPGEDQYSTVQHGTAQYSTVQHSTALAGPGEDERPVEVSLWHPVAEDDEEVLGVTGDDVVVLQLGQAGELNRTDCGAVNYLTIAISQ